MTLCRARLLPPLQPESDNSWSEESSNHITVLFNVLESSTSSFLVYVHARAASSSTREPSRIRLPSARLHYVPRVQPFFLIFNSRDDSLPPMTTTFCGSLARTTSLYERSVRSIKWGIETPWNLFVSDNHVCLDQLCVNSYTCFGGKRCGKLDFLHELQDRW